MVSISHALVPVFDFSKYEYEGESRNMAVTQFEAADARRCFPCWDEPAFKVFNSMSLFYKHCFDILQIMIVNIR
jgi:aminopeptidase N